MRAGLGGWFIALGRRDQLAILLGSLSGGLCVAHKGLCNAFARLLGDGPIRGPHNDTLNAYRGGSILNSSLAPVSGQSNWRWCSKCQGLAYAGNGGPGICPAGGHHDHTVSADYTLQLTGPVFINPVNGQILDFAGSYQFKVAPVAAAVGYLWSFFQNGAMVWENQRDEGQLSGAEYGIQPGTPAHSRFQPGCVQVWSRALVGKWWTEATIIDIFLH